MNAQLLELEEQVHKHSQNSSPSKKTSTSKVSGSKKREDAVVSSRSPLDTKESPYSGEIPSSMDSTQMTLSSPALQQLFHSLHQEIKNWKLLTTCRLAQSLKLRPLPIPRRQQALLFSAAHVSLISLEGGVEEKKECDIFKPLEMPVNRHEVEKLKRYFLIFKFISPSASGRFG